jgi:hypothetical protein
MNVIKGLGGTLSSAGTYRGSWIGSRSTAQRDAGLLARSGGQPVQLNTKFKAIVDGTNGDTILERVEALLNTSTIVATGSVVRTQE